MRILELIRLFIENWTVLCSLFCLCILQRMKQFLKIIKVRYLWAGLHATITCVTSRRKRINNINQSCVAFLRRKKKMSTDKKYCPQKHLGLLKINHDRSQRIPFSS